MAAVIAEFFVSLQDGVGMFVLFNARNFNHDVAVVGVVALVAFGLMFEITMNWVTPPPGSSPGTDAKPRPIDPLKTSIRSRQVPGQTVILWLRRARAWC